MSLGEVSSFRHIHTESVRKLESSPSGSYAQGSRLREVPPNKTSQWLRPNRFIVPLQSVTVAFMVNGPYFIQHIPSLINMLRATHHKSHSQVDAGIRLLRYTQHFLYHTLQTADWRCRGSGHRPSWFVDDRLYPMSHSRPSTSSWFIDLFLTHFLHCSSFEGRRSSWSQLTLGKRRSSPWTGHQRKAGPTYRYNHSHPDTWEYGVSTQKGPRPKQQPTKYCLD